MKKMAIPVLFFFSAFMLTSMSCSSSSSSSSSQNTPQPLAGPHWTTPLSSTSFIFASPTLVETTYNYLTIVSTDDPARSFILTTDKTSGAISKLEIPDYKVVNFVQDPDGDILSLNETGTDPDCQVRLTTFSPNGVKLKEAVFAGASLQYSNALAKCDDGVILGIYKSNDGPKLVKSDFNGNTLWQEQYANELDSGLEGEEYIEPGVIQCIKKDVDGNFVIAQQFTKKNTEDLEDCGYVIYQINSAGELLWSKPYYLGVTAWQQDTFAREMLLLEDGSIVIEESWSGGSPGQDIRIVYLDNAGDFIRKLHTAHTGKGPMALGSDQSVIYSNREYDPQLGKDETVCCKFGLDGTIIWKKTYNPETTDGTQLNVRPRAIFRCSDTGFLIVCEYRVDNTTDHGVALLKINGDGELIGRLSL